MVSAARPKPQAVPAAERLARAWTRHPVVSFLRHKKQLAFYRQFHSLLRAGVGLPVAFAELSKYAPSDALAKGLRTVSRDVQQGATLGEAFARHAALLEDANVELITFAEEAGKLDQVLATLIHHLEQVHQLRWRAVIMSIWPAYLAAAFIFVGPLLGAAQSVKSADDVGRVYFAGLAGNLSWAALLLGLVFGGPLVLAVLDLALPWDRLKRRAPLVSLPTRDLYASRMVLGLGLGIDAGLEVVRAVRVAVRATGSPSLEASLPDAEALIRRGGTLTEAIESLGLLDRSALGTLAVAERTGTIDETLARLAKELQESSLRAMKLLVFAVIAGVAGVLLLKMAGSLLGALFGPVKTMYDAAGSGNLDALGGP